MPNSEHRRDKAIVGEIDKRWQDSNLDPTMSYFYAQTDIRFLLEYVHKLEYNLANNQLENTCRKP